MNVYSWFRRTKWQSHVNTIINIDAVKFQEFPGHLSDYKLIKKKDSVRFYILTTVLWDVICLVEVTRRFIGACCNEIPIAVSLPHISQGSNPATAERRWRLTVWAMARSVSDTEWRCRFFTTAMTLLRGFRQCAKWVTLQHTEHSYLFRLRAEWLSSCSTQTSGRIMWYVPYILTKTVSCFSPVPLLCMSQSTTFRMSVSEHKDKISHLRPSSKNLLLSSHRICNISMKL